MTVQSLEGLNKSIQYSSQSVESDPSSEDKIEDKETAVLHENICPAVLVEEDLRHIETPPHKQHRTSTPDPDKHKPMEEEPLRCLLKEIINHPAALQVPPIDIVVAPGQQGANITEEGREYKPQW